MDAFFAAIEVRRRPELRGRPVIVGGRGDPTQRGVVSAASYEARACGVRSAMPLRTALRKCPGGVFLPVDMPEYERVSARIMGVLREIAPAVEEAGLDEAFLDLSGLPAASEALGLTVKAHIRAATGLSCSVGIAPNKLLAKIASDLKKPGGLTILEESYVPLRVWPLPVRRLPGVGPKTERRLLELGVTTIGELAGQPEARLAAEFGPGHGHGLREAAWGRDESPLVTQWEPRSLSREITFEKDVDDWGRVREAVAELAADLARRMAKESKAAGSVTVKLRYEDFETHQHGSALGTPSADPVVILETALIHLGAFPREKMVRLVGLRVGELVGTAQPRADVRGPAPRA